MTGIIKTEVTIPTIVDFNVDSDKTFHFGFYNGGVATMTLEEALAFSLELQRIVSIYIADEDIDDE